MDSESVGREAKVFSEVIMEYENVIRRENEVRLLAVQHNIKSLIRLRTRYGTVLS